MAASPQTENGYIKIADELWEAFTQADLWGSEWRVLFAVMRRTYGFSRCQDKISLSQIERATGLTRARANAALRNLERRNIITVDRAGYINQIGIQKDYEKWDIDSIVGDTSTLDDASIVGDTKTSIVGDTHNKQYTSMSFTEGSDAIRLSSLLSDLIHRNNPKAKKADLQKWAIHIDRLIRIDQRTPEEIEAVVRWCQEDPFWMTNILSTEKLRKQFDQLWLKVEKGSKKPECRNARPGYPPLRDQATSEVERCPCPACRAELERRSVETAAQKTFPFSKKEGA